MNKKSVIIIIGILFVAVIAAELWRFEYGYVVINTGDWMIENPLGKSIVIAAFVLLSLLVIFNGLFFLWRLPSNYSKYLARRNMERARHNIIQGLIELLEGHWHKAEQILLNDIENSETPLLNYLLAARAAQQQDADRRRDDYLKKAHEATPRADIAVGLTQAELQLAHGQTEQALATLTRLREIAPKHPYVLKMLSRLYTQLNEWEKLAALLPELRKRGIVEGEKLLQLERTTYNQFLRFISNSTAVFSLEEQWKLLPRRYRNDPEILGVYIDCLIKTKNNVAAEKTLRLYLNRNWEESLVLRYGDIQLSDASQQLNHAEAWLKDHGRSPMLLLALARLCNRMRLWGKARVYYESSIAIHASGEAYAELAELLETLGETDSAYNCLRDGIHFVTSKSHNRRTSDHYGITKLEKASVEDDSKKQIAVVK